MERRAWLRATAVASAALLCGCRRKTRGEVVVYCSVDESYARPVLDTFSSESGVAVRLVSDSEETKSAGLLSRLLAEKARPRADVFWSGDPARSELLKRHSVSTPYFSPQRTGLPETYGDPAGHYTGFSARARALVFNRRLPASERPNSVLDLAKPELAARACIANPLFGTTSMHVAALFTALGDAQAQEFLNAFSERGGRMLSSNGEVRRRVASGDFLIGITDSDDVAGAMSDSQPLDFIFPDQEGLGTLAIPNTVSLINHGPNADNGRALIDYLLSERVEGALARSEAAQFPLRPDLPPPPMFGRPIGDIRQMKVSYETIAAKMESLSGGFLLNWTERQMRR